MIEIGPRPGQRQATLHEDTERVACPCPQLGDVERVTDQSRFYDELARLDCGDRAQLRECRQCGQLWAIDDWDKHQTQLATKVAPERRRDWQARDVAAEKAFLLRARGGETSEPCLWSRCRKPRVSRSDCCLDHLYESGARD